MPARPVTMTSLKSAVLCGVCAVGAAAGVAAARLMITAPGLKNSYFRPVPANNCVRAWSCVSVPLQCRSLQARDIGFREHQLQARLSREVLQSCAQSFRIDTVGLCLRLVPRQAIRTSAPQTQKDSASRMCYLHALIGRSWQPNPQGCH